MSVVTASTDRPPLDGIRVIDMGGVGPGPFATMMLSDLGAEVTAIKKAGADGGIVGATTRSMSRGKQEIHLDIKDEADRAQIWKLLEEADVLVEGFRPEVMERLGFGPDEVGARCPSLIYARVTGWGREGPKANEAGHDINYIALTGLLDQVGHPRQPPVIPLNVVADFAGGGMFVVAGILAALVERSRSGKGQVVDTAMIHGVAYLQAMVLGLRKENLWQDQRGTNFVDGSRPFYTTYATADGGAVAVGCLEDRFYAEFLRLLGLPAADWDRSDPARWPQQRFALAAIFAAHDRTHWDQLFAGSDACVTPILSLAEAARHPHVIAEGAFIGSAPDEANVAPRFSRTRTDVDSSTPDTMAGR
ncbi:CaiB/BaiF CoA transferase family protein [Nocardia sp. NPDC059239]|uniref:CaiB/BaiF CoA transferase family protein n=1 Tax=unclassified Nocardia TaxID=2637762 RepID=UPI0036D12EE8